MAKILIIEDDKYLIENVTELLQSHEYVVLNALNGSDGLNIAIEQLPDLIICDINLPGMDGYQILKKLRSFPKTFSIPLIFLTARSDITDHRFGMELGADDYITKPFNNNDIVKSVEVRLAKSNQTKLFYEERLEQLRMSIASTIPHEMRTPLNIIMGFLQIIRSSDDLRKEELNEMYDSMYTACKRLLRLISNYSIFTKLQSSNENDFNQMAVIADLDKSIMNICLNTSISYSRQDDLEMQLVNGKIKLTESYFQKVVEELIDNSFKFSPKNSKVTIESSITSDNFYKLSVMNSGRGMTNEQIRSISAFNQFDRKEYEQQGSGLGLHITKRIVELSGGSFNIQSLPGIKTTLQIIIPMYNDNNQ